MRVIPVLDLSGGRAVHARAGDRASYALLSSQLAPDRPGDPGAIARAFRDRLGLRELYIADLDAIAGRAPQRESMRGIMADLPDVAVWVDAGVARVEDARDLLEDGVARVIVGLETLPTSADPRVVLEHLAVATRSTGPGAPGRPGEATPSDADTQPEIAGQPIPGRRPDFGGRSNATRQPNSGRQPNATSQPDSGGQPDATRQPNSGGQPDATGQPDAAGQSNTAPRRPDPAGQPRRAVFSLDLRDGRPLAANPALRSLHPIAIAELAAECGFETIIALDLARVGMGNGPDLAMLRELRRALPRVELASGGGIRDAADLQRLADAGADAALVGSALHHGSTDHGSILWPCGASFPDVISPPMDA